MRGSLGLGDSLAEIVQCNLEDPCGLCKDRRLEYPCIRGSFVDLLPRLFPGEHLVILLQAIGTLTSSCRLQDDHGEATLTASRLHELKSGIRRDV